MKITETRIPDVKLIEPKVFGDERGFFMETWNDQTFREAGIAETFVQDNHSRSVKNTLRGLHYQIKQPQGKLVRSRKYPYPARQNHDRAVPPSGRPFAGTLG